MQSNVLRFGSIYGLLCESCRLPWKSQHFLQLYDGFFLPSWWLVWWYRFHRHSFLVSHQHTWSRRRRNQRPFKWLVSPDNGRIDASLSSLVPRVNQTTVSNFFTRFVATLSPFCAANGSSYSAQQDPLGVGIGAVLFEVPDLYTNQFPLNGAVGYGPGVSNVQQVVNTAASVDTQFVVFDTGLPFNMPAGLGGKAGLPIVNRYFGPSGWSTAPTFPNLTRVAHTVRSFFLL